MSELSGMSDLSGLSELSGVNGVGEMSCEWKRRVRTHGELFGPP